MHIFIFVFFVLLIWQYDAFCITVIFMVFITMILALVFIVFKAPFLNMFIKLFYITGTFIHFSIIICINFLLDIFRGFFCYFMFGSLFFLVFALLFYVFVNVLLVFNLFTNFKDYNSSSGSTVFHFHVNFDKDATYLQTNNNASSKNPWLLFSAWSLFWKVWFNKSGNITLRLFLFLVIYLLLFLHKHIKSPDHQEAIGSCSRYEFFTSDFNDT